MAAGFTYFEVIGGIIGNACVVGYDADVDLDGNVVTVSGLNAGDYKLEVVTIPDDSHSSVTKLFDIRVNKIDSSVSGDDIVFDYSSSNSTTLSVLVVVLAVSVLLVMMQVLF